jgi:hypothetical protein
MAQPLGLLADPSAAASERTAAPLGTAKKKGCRKTKCSKWKGGKCCCGRSDNDL